MATTYNVLGISGSLRSRSSNTEALRAAAILAPAAVRFQLTRLIGSLPPFNPDLDFEGASLPAHVKKFRNEIGAADAVVICSPEYAHGVPGSLKNALDWLVSFPGMVFKPVVLMNISPRSSHAYASLVETLRTMSTEIVENGLVLQVPTGLDAAGIATQPAFANAIRIMWDSVCVGADAYRARLSAV